MNLANHTTQRTLLAAAVTTVLGTAVIPDQATAQVLEFTWDGLFTIIDSGGGPLANSSLPKAANQFQTPINGTFTFDTDTGAGTGIVLPFQFFNGAPSLPATAKDLSVQSIGDGSGGLGTLVLGNALFDWNGSYNIPVSLVWDAAGLFGALTGLSVGETVSGTGATPASDGSYTNVTWGYLAQGPTPIATTTFNTTNESGCATSSCTGVNPSGVLPIITDTAENYNKGYYTPGNTIGISGNPMQDGPFLGFNASFDVSKLTLVNDGTGSITAPGNINLPIPETPPPPQSTTVDLGTPADVTPATALAEYCLETAASCDANNTWIPSSPPNTITVDITQTVNIVNVDWRSAVDGTGLAFDAQVVTATVNDTIPPAITAPADVAENVTSTSDEICFGAGSATDVWDANPKTEYSINSLANWQLSDPADNCSTALGPNANTVNWRATDTKGNVSAPVAQTVTLNLPTGIVGKACTINLDYEGPRNLAGSFIMRDPAGAQVGSDDDTVTGVIDTTELCTDPVCTNVGASLSTIQPFQGLLWSADPITLYGPGDWTFESCLDDGSIQCTLPTPVSMTVNEGQLGAHMLFAWGSVESIDVAVVWDVDCGKQQLTTTDPLSTTDPNQPDGIIGTSMVDGPFKGFNAAFNVSGTGTDPEGNEVPLIADGGYLVDIPTYKNPVDGASPFPLTYTMLSAGQLPADSAVVSSCNAGGCFSFETEGVIAATDANGDYQYVQVVLPLDDPIPWYSLYRKILDPATGAWMTLLPDARNNVKSAARGTDTGFCPQPGAGDYREADANSNLANMLQPDDECIQLTIEDNGPYDTNMDPGIVADPGGIGQTTTTQPTPEADTTDGGGCSITQSSVDPLNRSDWGLLAGLLALLGFFRRRRSSRNT